MRERLTFNNQVFEFMKINVYRNAANQINNI